MVIFSSEREVGSVARSEKGPSGFLQKTFTRPHRSVPDHQRLISRQIDPREKGKHPGSWARFRQKMPLFMWGWAIKTQDG
jgi:hypothetical protein